MMKRVKVFIDKGTLKTLQEDMERGCRYRKIDTLKKRMMFMFNFAELERLVSKTGVKAMTRSNISNPIIEFRLSEWEEKTIRLIQKEMLEKGYERREMSYAGVMRIMIRVYVANIKKKNTQLQSDDLRFACGSLDS